MAAGAKGSVRAQVGADFSTLSITIDGKPYTCEKGEYLLEVAKRNGIFIPTLCHHEGLLGLGACRICIVEVIERGRSRVVVSCIFPVESEIEVLTASDKIKEQRGVIITLLARLAPASDVIKAMADYMGVKLERLTDVEGGEKCILCGRCTTACENIGTGAIAKVSRGITKEIATPYHHPSVECIGCTACAQVCPTGQIEYAEDGAGVEIWGKRFEYLVCGECGRRFATAEQYLFAAGKHGVEAPKSPLCDECEKLATAARLAKSAQGFDAARVGIEGLIKG